ncbi:fimbria/pilus outer membrane usher protein [Escherichia coli]
MYRTHRQHSLLSSGGVPSFIGGLVVFVSAAFNAQAETWFDPAFFKDDPSMVADLSRFEKGQKITPGVYRVDIVLNQTIVDTRNVNFVEITPEKGIAACLTTESLDAMGVNTDAFPAFKQLDKQACVPLAEIIPDASVTFNVNKLRLEISVPQIAIKSNARGYVPPERWDEGINALLLGYSFSGANSIHSSADSDSGDSYFLNLNSGVNLGPWRLRNNSTWSRSSGQTAEWKNLSSYLQRAVIPLKGELTVCDDYTAGDFFDSVSFRGVQLASDDNMLPDSLKGFAPVVRGIAKSNAQITIKQNGCEYGSFYLSGSQQTYWHTDQQDRLLQFGYNTQIKDLSLGVSWNYSKSRGQPDADQVFALNFSLQLNLLLPRSNDSYTRKKNYAWMTSNTSIDNEGHITQNLGLTETLLDDGNLSYSVQQGYNSEGKTANGSASMDYKGAFADARVGYNYSDNGSQQQLNYALSGSLVAHSQGITLGQSLGETNVLIAAPGAENTRVANSTGLKTDWRGYTVVPYATSYRENRIALDAASLKRNVDLENAVVNVVPTKGALVLAEFNAHAGARVLMKTSKQGIPLRFGAIATLDGIQTNSGIIDDDGSLYMSGLPAQGAITVRWGEAPDQICHISYQLTEQQINSAITRMDAICR